MGTLYLFFRESFVYHIMYSGNGVGGVHVVAVFDLKEKIFLSVLRCIKIVMFIKIIFADGRSFDKSVCPV